MKIDWESRFSRWASPPSGTEQDKCDNAIRAIRTAVSASTALKSRNILVFVQGSYRNRVNVRQDSDVDVGVALYDYFLAQYPGGRKQEDFGNSSVDYSFARFKNELEEALVDHFGRSAVTRGNKAFDVKANTYRVDADVVPLFEFRQYWESGTFRAGVALLPDNGTRIENYPERLLAHWPNTPLHYENGVAKNDRTGHRFKGMVRILKSLKNEMADAGIPAAKAVPSYLIECLVWNVPDNTFASNSWTERIQGALLHIWTHTAEQSLCNEWCEVDEIKYLFRASQPWTRSEACDFVARAYQYLKDAGL